MTIQPPDPPISVALLDLYDGEPNHGMRAIQELLQQCSGRFHGLPIAYTIYETRLKGDVPDLEHDVYVSSGGPGSPFDGEGKAWERRYFRWLDALWNHNERRRGAAPGADAKHALFICHSYQMMCRFFEVGQVTRRRSESFGIFPIYKTPAGQTDPLFAHLPDPFYGADFRHWQVIQPQQQRLDALGARVLALEKNRRHVALERATMALRLSPEIVGVQFHPEADPPGMRDHFSEPKRRKTVVHRHGVEKYERIMRHLEDPAYLKWTYDTVIPNFLRQAIEGTRPERVKNEAA